MKMQLPLPRDKKLTVLYRVEPGCLGPDGKQHIDAFCKFAELVSRAIHEQSPRHDKTLAETQYKVGDKNLSHDQAARYLHMFGKQLDEFEEHLHDALASSIDEFMQP